MEDLLEALTRAADGAYIVDAQQRIIFWNKAAENLLGYTADEVVGRTCYQVFGGRDEIGCPICRRRCVPFVASGRGEPVPSFDARVRGKDGREHWLNVSIIALPGAGDTAQAIIHLFRNIDAQKQAEDFVGKVVSQARQIDLQKQRSVGSRKVSPKFPPSAWPRQEPWEQRSAGSPETNPTPEQLTPREYRVLEILAQGADTAAIARQLVISETTVRNHIQHILHKFGVHSRLEAVAYAREHGLI